MSDIILTGLKINNSNHSEASKILKPLKINSEQINNNQNLSSDRFKKNSSISQIQLLDPVIFFENPNANKNNNILIEGNVSSKNISSVKNIPGTNWLGKLESNGNRDVAILIPPNSNPNKPYEIVFYFHGHNGKMDKILSSNGNGIKDSIINKSKNKNIIVVIPQGPIKELDYTWMNSKFNENMSKFQTETINIIKNKLNPFINIESITVAGHSAGGIPILNASRERTLTANKIKFLDSTYGNWASETYNNIRKKNLNITFDVIYIPGTETQIDALNLKNKSGVQISTTTYSHSEIPKKFF